MSKIRGFNENSSSVILNVYDLNESNDTLINFGLGVFHTGVQIGREEYTFSSAGIFNHSPKSAGNAKFRESIDLGHFKGGSRDIDNIIKNLSKDFRPNDYHILSKNCNSFSEAFVKQLIGKDIPPHINRLASIGSMFSCLLPESMLKEAPVEDAAASNRQSGYTAVKNPVNNISAISKRSSVSNSGTTPFSGTGMKLGSN